jgi:hypothetical protein
MHEMNNMEVVGISFYIFKPACNNSHLQPIIKFPSVKKKVFTFFLYFWLFSYYIMFKVFIPFRGDYTELCGIPMTPSKLGHHSSALGAELATILYTYTQDENQLRV